MFHFQPKISSRGGISRACITFVLISWSFTANPITSAFNPVHVHTNNHRPPPPTLLNNSGLVLRRLDSVRLTTAVNDDDGTHKSNIEKFLREQMNKAVNRFKAKPRTYLLMPCVAALVGWLTNWLAVQMIFYPVRYRGLPIYRRNEVPLGLFGWQGIVPCKTRPMTETMVNMVTTQLLSVQEVFRRLDPRKIAELLAPEVSDIGQSVLDEVLPFKWIAKIPSAFFSGLPTKTKDLLTFMNYRFLKEFTVAMQGNINSLFNVRNCVVDQMMQDRNLLGDLFRKCGQKELDFLTNSGLWFGFMLGLLQMTVALFCDNPWVISVGGGIVGFATNWLALKWIFEPVNPTKFGPFILQGKFLTRQKEVSAAFSDFFANKILTSEKMWHTILTDPETTPAFEKLFGDHLRKFTTTVTSGFGIKPEPEVFTLAVARAMKKLPEHVGVLHSYVDAKLNLQETLRISMENMSSAQFERVLHPIFEEDELTLILAGAALGFGAGLIQQGLETGKLTIPSRKQVWEQSCKIRSRVASLSPSKMVLNGVKVASIRIGNGINRFVSRNKNPTDSVDSEDLPT